ncbi:MAG: flagellar hook-length control protein FliK, partial [Gammaproteobacteria bacterium]
MSDMAPLPASTDTGISQNQGNGQNTIQGNSIAGSVKSALGLSNKPVTDEAESSEASFVDFLQGILQPQTTAAETSIFVNSGNALPLPGQLPTQAASSGQPLQALTDAADSQLLPAAGLLPGQIATDEAMLTAAHSAAIQSASPLSAESISKSIAVSLNAPAGLKAESTAAANRLPVDATITNALAGETSDLQIESLPQLRSSSASAVPLMELSAGRQGMDTTLPASTTLSDSISASLLRSPLPQSSMITESTFQLSTPTITENFGRPDWNQGLGRQIMWMVNQNMQSAEIRLNPAHLGPIEVRIEMDN